MVSLLNISLDTYVRKRAATHTLTAVAQVEGGWEFLDVAHGSAGVQVNPAAPVLPLNMLDDACAMQSTFKSNKAL